MVDIGIVVMVEEGQRAQIDELARTLKAAGLDVTETLPRFRTIIGTGDASILDDLRRIDGVETARAEERYQLPPGDPDVPQ